MFDHLNEMMHNPEDVARIQELETELTELREAVRKNMALRQKLEEGLASFDLHNDTVSALKESDAHLRKLIEEKE